MSERVSAALAAAEVQDLAGASRRLETLWADGSVLLLWVRHFG
jgi:hypothetical protein